MGLISWLLACFTVDKVEKKRDEIRTNRVLSARDERAFIWNREHNNIPIGSEEFDQISFLVSYDREAMVDRLVGTMDRSDPKWIERYRHYTGRYGISDLYDDYAMMMYGKHCYNYDRLKEMGYHQAVDI